MAARIPAPHTHTHLYVTMRTRDSGFPRGGANPGGGASLLFSNTFTKNCMEMKRIGLRGVGRASLGSNDSIEICKPPPDGTESRET